VNRTVVFVSVPGLGPVSTVGVVLRSLVWRRFVVCNSGAGEYGGGGFVACFHSDWRGIWSGLEDQMGCKVKKRGGGGAGFTSILR